MNVIKDSNADYAFLELSDVQLLALMAASIDPLKSVTILVKNGVQLAYKIKTYSSSTKTHVVDSKIIKIIRRNNDNGDNVYLTLNNDIAVNLGKESPIISVVNSNPVLSQDQLLSIKQRKTKMMILQSILNDRNTEFIENGILFDHIKTENKIKDIPSIDLTLYKELLKTLKSEVIKERMLIKWDKVLDAGNVNIESNHWDKFIKSKNYNTSSLSYGILTGKMSQKSTNVKKKTVTSGKQPSPSTNTGKAEKVAKQALPLKIKEQPHAAIKGVSKREKIEQKEAQATAKPPLKPRLQIVSKNNQDFYLSRIVQLREMIQTFQNRYLIYFQWFNELDAVWKKYKDILTNHVTEETVSKFHHLCGDESNISTLDLNVTNLANIPQWKSYIERWNERVKQFMELHNDILRMRWDIFDNAAKLEKEAIDSGVVTNGEEFWENYLFSLPQLPPAVAAKGAS